MSEPLALLIPDLPRREALARYLERIDEAAWYTNHGPMVRALEERAALLFDAEPPPRCAAVASGTTAIALALRALALPSGSRVLVPAFTFPGTVIAVQHAAHQPVLCDVDETTWSLSPGLAAEQAKRHGCAAIVPVATFGVALDVAQWDECAMRSGAAVVIDGAGSLGAMSPGRRASVAYSLHATKPLGIGEGGLVASREPGFVDRVRRLANFGFARGVVEEAGTNAKLSEYAAAVGLAQLDRAAELLSRRDALWDVYRRALSEVGELRLQPMPGTRAPACVVVRTRAGAAACADALAHARIETRRWYCPPIHRHPAFAGLPRAGSLEVAEDLGQSALGVPFHTRMQAADFTRVARALDRSHRGVT